MNPSLFKPKSNLNQKKSSNSDFLGYVLILFDFLGGRNLNYFEILHQFPPKIPQFSSINSLCSSPSKGGQEKKNRFFGPSKNKFFFHSLTRDSVKDSLQACRPRFAALVKVS